jgi:hypothetical protein
MPRPSCQTCIHEVVHDLRPVCLKYLCYTRIYRICDDWEAGGPTSKDALTGTVLVWRNDDEESEDDEAYLNSQVLTDEE